MSRSTSFDTENEPIERRIAVGLNKIGLALKLQSWRTAGERGLTPLQGQVLAMLLPDRSGVRPSTLASRLAVTAATISESVAALSSKGLVERRPDPDDGRVNLVSLSSKGRTVARQAAGWPDFLSTAVESLSEDEQEVFWKGLLKLIRSLQQAGQVPTSEMCLSCVHFRPSVHKDPGLPHHCALVNAPMGHRHLRLECDEHELASPEVQAEVWAAFTS